MIQSLQHLLHARHGTMTEELVLRPGDFGLGHVPARLKPSATIQSTCGFCATGCRLDVHLDAEGRALNLSPTREYPVNLGMACPKGWEALTPLAAADRATVPLLRRPRSDRLEPVDWPTAIRAFVTRLKAIGAANTAFLSTGQIATEEMALLGALFKFGMGGLHADSNTRQCMATAHVAYKQSFGFDAPPYTYADFEAGDVLVFIGSNPAIAHPIMWQRVMRNPNRPEIIVIDPRRTETAMCATRHVPIAPRGDLWLLYGIAHELIARDTVDRDFVRAHTRGFEAFAEFIREFPPSRCAPLCGVSDSTIRELAGIIAGGRAVSFWWTMGVNQGHQSTRTAQAIINLALMTGNIGRPGTGANSITGQCNAMGSRLFSNTTSLLGGRDFADTRHRAEVREILGLPDARIPTEPSLAYDRIIDAIESGHIRGLWVVATNPAHSWIDHLRLRRLRDRLDFLVVQDMYATTETARLADLVLPAAGWGEKEGTLINSERRISTIRKVARAPGQALSDFHIFKLIAEAWGCADLFRDWRSPAETFQILKALSRGRPFDITGIRDYDHLDAAGGIQWPWPESAATRADPERERRLFADGRFFTGDGRAVFHFDPPASPPETPDAAYPFWLNSGRGSSAQWHTGTRTNKSDVLRKLAPGSLYVEINPADAKRMGITSSDTVEIRSRRGAVTATAFITTATPPGQVFLPMHFDGVNALTFPAFDPHSRQPSFKACAVALAPIATDRPSATPAESHSSFR